MKRPWSLLIVLLLVAGLVIPAGAQPPPVREKTLPAATHAGSEAQLAEGGVEIQPPIEWIKTLDGINWTPGMSITRQTSDTIVVQEILVLTPPPAGSMPFVPVRVDGPREAAPLTPSSPAHPLGAPGPAAHPEAILWDQALSTVNQSAYVDQDFPDFAAYSAFLADDFTNGEAWQISTIFVPGDGWNGFTSLLNATALTWQIYADNAGVPAGDPAGGGSPPVWTLTLTPGDPQVVLTNGTPGGMPSNVQLNLFAPLLLPAGTWWLVFYPTMSYGSYGQYGRQAADTTNGYTAQFINPGGGFGYGTGWQNWGVVGPTQQDIAFRLEGTLAAQNWAQIENWNPEHLRLLDWAATGGNVVVQPGMVEWTGQLVGPTVVTLTKWFHVEPCTWTVTLLSEELWLGPTELEQRPVTVNKMPPALWLNAFYDAGVVAGAPAGFLLQYGNDGGFEPDVLLRSEFPPEAPFVSAVPPPTAVDPGGMWAEWFLGSLPQGSAGQVSVTVMIDAGLPPGGQATIACRIFDHVLQRADMAFIVFVVGGANQHVYLPLVAKGWGP